jgi:hypothetical protein
MLRDETHLKLYVFRAKFAEFQGPESGDHNTRAKVFVILLSIKYNGWLYILKDECSVI